MALIVPNSGETLALSLFVNKIALPENLKLRLYENNITPSETDTVATYTTATFTGYADVTLTGASWTITGGTPSTATYAQQTFTSSAAGQTKFVYGCAYIRATTGDLVAAERFNRIYQIANLGDAVKVTPQITLDTVVIAGGVRTPTLANLATGWIAGDNPPRWDNVIYDVVPYEAGSGGSSYQIRWRLDGGAWVTEDWQTVDDELITGVFVWPLLNNANLNSGPLFDVQGRHAINQGLVSENMSAWSNIWTDDLTAITITVPIALMATAGRTGYIFDPTDLTKLNQQYANDGPAVTTVGQPIGYLRDVSNKNNHFIARGNDTTRPALADLGGGKYVVRFDGVNDVMQLAQALVFDNNGGTLVFALKGLSGQTNRTIWSEGDSSLPNPYVILGTTSVASDDSRIRVRNDSGTTIEDTIATLNNFDGTIKIITMTFNATQTQIDIRVNRSATWSIHSWPANTITTNVTSIGALVRTTVAEYFAGDFGRWGGVGGSALTAQELIDFEDWCAAPYGIVLP